MVMLTLPLTTQKGEYDGQARLTERTKARHSQFPLHITGIRERSTVWRGPSEGLRLSEEEGSQSSKTAGKKAQVITLSTSSN